MVVGRHDAGVALVLMTALAACGGANPPPAQGSITAPGRSAPPTHGAQLSSPAAPTPTAAVRIDTGRFSTAASVAAELAAVEPMLASPTTPAALLDGLAHRQQVAYLVLTLHPGWGTAGHPAVPTPLPPA